MQCVNCRFQNIPGSEACGRCGTSLNLATATIDVEPPRAAPWRKQVRRWLQFRRAAARARDAAQGIAAGAEMLVCRGLRIPLPRFELLWRLIVPGWAHFRAGQVIRGCVFLALWVAFLAGGLFYLGSFLSALLFGLAIGLHACSVMDILLQCPGEFASRFGTVAVIQGALLGGLYLPLGWLLTWVASPFAIAQTSPPFVEGDLLLYAPAAYTWSAPRAGDVVVYRIQQQTLTPEPGVQQPPVFVPQLDLVDRILAGPGSEVMWVQGHLYVDGEETDLGPLNPVRIDRDMMVRVPAGHYFILPSTLRYRMYGNFEFEFPWDAESVNCIRAESVLGPVYLRHQPLARFGRIR